MSSQSPIEQLLAPLQESIIHKPPFVAGSLQLPPSHLSLLYKVTSSEGNHATRHIDFANATPEELEQLIQACGTASFGCGTEDVTDETYRKAKRMDKDSFSAWLVPDNNDLVKIMRDYLLEGTDSDRKIKIELQNLNVYSQGSFFKAHVDTPRSKRMFGTLVVVFPTPHKGGALVFRHRGEEWTFDSSDVLSAAGPASIGYAAFFSDVEHEVLPVTSGHRVTLTYKLYFVNDERALKLVSEPPPLPQLRFRSIFEALLKDPEFLPDGGTLGFGMRHVYPVKANRGLKHIYSLLKGSDATIYQSLRALGLEPILYLNYRHEGDNVGSESVMINEVPSLDQFSLVDELFDLLRNLDG
ncbi:hypothetical protein BGW80DRAFT_1209092, partial [Lactifluus volemus]